MLDDFVDDLRSYVAHLAVYVRALVRWLIGSGIIGVLCGAVGSAFHKGVEVATEFRLAHLWVIGVFVGSVVELNLIWNIADLLNGLMAIPNIAAVLLLSGLVARETKKYSGDHIHDRDDTEIPTLRNSKSGVLF